MKHIRPNKLRMNYIYISLIILLTSGCGKSQNQPARDENPDFQNAVWITDNRVWPEADSLLYGDFPAPLFRKEFFVKKEVKAARLFITAAGYYSASVNGKTLDKNYLDPAWTDFSKRIYYSVLDVTSDIKEGKNCLGITLGNGFYNPLPMKMWGRYNLRKNIPIGNPKTIARMKIEYQDGSIQEVITDNSWKYAYGPILKNNVYLGEVYNAGREKSGWNMTGFDDNQWEKSLENEGPGGELQKAFFPPVQVTGIQKPVAVLSPENGIYIIDLGVNFTGLYRIRLNGQPGDTITFRFGERLYENGTLNPMTAVCGQIKEKGIGGPGSPDVAWQTDSFIFGDKTEEWYSPLFTFHVFRYMEISGLTYKPDITDAEGIVFNSNVEDNNSFSCSSQLLNSIQKATERTFLDNLIGVQSDCPGREKFGYGGDLNATAEAFIYNFDMQTFYRKTIYDWVDVLNDTIFVDTAPYVKLNYCGISWESAFLITQYQLLLYYNDVDLIRELYGLDLKWMDKAARLHPDGIVNKGLADHESLVEVPVELIGTTHYLACARIMKKFAGLMKDKDNEEKFSRLAKELNKSLLDRFWRKSVPDPINRQTLFSALLYYDVVPENEKKAAIDSLFKALKKAPAGHFTTGIFGTKYILETLSETDNTGSVFNIVNSTAYPGWGFMIDHGATTIWETWKESDNTYSNCHPMFGSVSEWFYRWIAGIQPDPENPGFRKFIISPFVPSDLTYVNCTYQSPFGIIKSNWEKTKNATRFEISVPKNTSAYFRIPDTVKVFAEIENTDSKTRIRKNIKESGYGFELTEGNYIISL
jgi:alpha-L-rhamnosidase